MGTHIVLPGQAAAPPGPVDVIGMYVMHHAFRRDLGAFAAAVPATPVDDRTTWRALAARWARFADILHKHHTVEDVALWPLLVDRAAAAGDADGLATLAAMEAEHTEVDPLLTSCAAGLARLADVADPDTRDALAVRVVALRDRLGAHLTHEERDAIALVQRYLTQADWDRLEKERFKPAHHLRDMPFIAAWMMHRMPADQFGRIRESMASRPMELIWRLFWKPTFERRERVAFRYG